MAVTVTPDVLIPGDIVRLGTGQHVYRIEEIVGQPGFVPSMFEIKALKCRTGEKSTLILGSGALISRLEQLPRSAVSDELNELHPGDTLAITYWDMAFWA